MRMRCGRLSVMEKRSPAINAETLMNGSEVPTWHEVVNRKVGGSSVTDHVYFIFKDLFIGPMLCCCR